ncbi:hypothetical protein [Acidisoma sp. 7E03]
MSEYEDTSAALRRLEAALNRIAAQVAKPRTVPAAEATPGDDVADHAAAPSRAAFAAPVDDQTRHEVVAKLDDLIGGLRSALGIARPS